MSACVQMLPAACLVTAAPRRCPGKLTSAAVWCCCVLMPSPSAGRDTLNLLLCCCRDAGAGSVHMMDKVLEVPRRSGASPARAAVVPSVLVLLALALLAGPALLETARQAAAQLALPGWSRWHTTSPRSLPGQPLGGTQPGILLSDEQLDAATAQPVGVRRQQQDQQRGDGQQQEWKRPLEVVSLPADWERRPQSAFLAPVSGCMISPDGELSWDSGRPAINTHTQTVPLPLGCSSCHNQAIRPSIQTLPSTDFSFSRRQRDARSAAGARPAALPIQHHPGGCALQA